MFKKATAISLLFLANIILLAVAIVPHHHHGDMICFAASHCHHRTLDCEADTPCCRHDAQQPENTKGHEHNDNGNCCKVGEWLLPNIEPEHKHQHHCFCTTCDSNNDLFVAILPDLSLPIIQPVNLPFRQTPTDNTILQISVSRIHGLRAPPFY